MGRYRRYVIALAIVVVLTGVYAAAGFLGLPYFARRGAQDFVRTHYGRTLAIGDIRFNPFTLTLEVRRLALPDADGQTLLAFERLHVELQLATLWRFAPSFRAIILEQPYLRAVLRPGGEVNLADLGKGFAPSPRPPPPKPAPLRLYIQRFAVISGNGTFEDRTRATPFHAEFTPIAFELRDFSTTAATGNTYTLNAASPQGERLIWSGTLRLAPLSSHGVFEIAHLKARTVWNYLRASLPFQIAAGVIGIRGDYDLRSGGGPLGLDVNVRSTKVSGLALRPRWGTEDYVVAAGIEVDDTRIDLAKHAVSVAKIALAGGDIRAWRSEQGRVNLLELLAPAAAAGAPAAPAVTDPEASTGGGAPDTAAGTATARAAATPMDHAAAPAWTVSAPDITVQGLKVSAEDRQLRPAAALLLSPLNLHVGGFTTAPDCTLDITLDSAVNGVGTIKARAQLAVKSAAVDAHIEAANLGLIALQPYVAQYTSMTLLKGALGARLDVGRRADGTLEVKGITEVSDLRTVDNTLKMDFIKWRGLRVADIHYASSPASLRIGSITAIEPYVRMVIAPDRTVNITRILTPPGAARSTPAAGPGAQGAGVAAVEPAPEAVAAPAAAPAAAPPVVAATPHSAARRGARPAARGATAAPVKPLAPFPMSIGVVRFVNASANYSDLWIKPSFAVGIQTLSGTLTGLSSDPRSRAQIALDGKVDRYSPVHIGGAVNLLSAALYTDVTMSFKDLDLTIVNPYSGYFAGYLINKGKLSVDVSYKIDQRQLDARQHFVVDQLELGDRVDSPGAAHLPLKIAVALLKDRNGVIDLELPMNGSLDDPKFRIGPILWKVFTNLIVKAATAPFALLGHLFGGGEHMNVVEFAPGSAELDPPAHEQLAALAKALGERPQLKLDVPIVFSSTLDAPQIAAARLKAELAARVLESREGRKHADTAVEVALADPARHFRLLVEQYRADLGKDAPLPPAAVAIEQSKGKETSYDAAIADLNAALIDHLKVADADLQALGKQRAQAIQDALLSGSHIEPTRIFIVNAPPQTQPGDKVKAEMAVK
jgi:hypothetical protein